MTASGRSCASGRDGRRALSGQSAAVLDRAPPSTSRFPKSADVLVICGDLTDYGLPEEAQIVVRGAGGRCGSRSSPCWATTTTIRQQDEVRKILDRRRHPTCSTASACEIDGVGFAGCKGFCGGFGKRTLDLGRDDHQALRARGASTRRSKAGVRACARLRTPQRIAVLHYAPIQATVEGEPPEIFAFLGSSRLEDPDQPLRGARGLSRACPSAAIPQGQRRAGIPVFNVSVSLLERTFPDKPLFHLIEVPVEGPGTI